MPNTNSGDCRLTIHRLSDGIDRDAFAGDVRSGLTANPKWLFAKYFYDELGSRIFEAICCLPEYYPTRAEREILHENSAEIVGAFASPVRIVELGSGNSEKTRLLIEAVLRRQLTLHYIPIDISGASLDLSSKELLRLYPNLNITAYAADYFAALERLAKENDDCEPEPPVANTVDRHENERSGNEGERTMALFLGSNIGNFDPETSIEFLRAVRRILCKGDGLLLGADLKKSPDVLIPAYDDSIGLTAAFNLNILERINRELGGEFDVTRFQHRALYNEGPGRVEMHLVSRVPQAVSIRSLGMKVSFEEGESIHTESSYKYDLGQLAAFARKTGFRLTRTWFDSRRLFSFNLFSVA